jgi:hypothetical protein
VPRQLASVHPFALLLQRLCLARTSCSRGRGGSTSRASALQDFLAAAAPSSTSNRLRARADCYLPELKEAVYTASTAILTLQTSVAVIERFKLLGLTMADSSALQIAALSSAQLSVISGPPQVGNELHTGPAGTVFEYAPDGKLFVQCDSAAISFYSEPGSEPVSCNAESRVARLCFSPTGAPQLVCRTDGSRASQQRT